MAITIRELLASDTISQAADKINFNFDQLLLNGGGPQGPQGPQGPPGPIGGRGIRGSVWYEGTADPTVTPPTATPEDEDNYLQSNGDVWTYDASIPGWVNTGINLQGPTGPTGSGGKFAEYQAVSTYGPAGDTTIFPDEMSLASSTAPNQGVRSVLIGGFPASPAFAPTTTGTNIVPQSIATSLEKGSYTMMLHQFDANDTALVFHGGDATQNFSQAAITDLSYIKLEADDALRIVSPKGKTAGQANQGIFVEATKRAIDLKAGAELTIRTGTSGLASNYVGVNIFDVSVGNSNLSANQPYAQIRTEAATGGEALFKLGTTAAPPTTSSLNGSIYLQGGRISLIGSNAMNLRTSSTINVIGGGLVRVQSTNNNLQMWAIGATSVADLYANQDVVVHSKVGDVHIYTESAGGDVLIDTSNAGSQIKLETTGSTAPINLSTTNTGSDINLETTGNAAAINLTTNANSSAIKLETLGGSSPIELDTNGSNIELTATGLGGINLAGTSGITASSAGGSIVLSTAANSTNIQLITTGIGSNVRIQAPTGVNPATINDTNIKVNGSNHITHSTQLTTPLDENIMLSGRYSGVPASSGGSTILTSSWIRIGNVVTFSGFGNCASGSALTFDLPIVESGGGGLGSGTATLRTIPPLGSPTVEACTVACSGATFSISNGAGIVSPGIGDTSFTFSFTYTLVP